MRDINCNAIRRELDELNLDENCSAPAMLHLQQCSDCQEFQRSRTRLRQLIGSLEAVEAPADFDFRLRSRLANERPGSAGSAGGFLFAGWLFGARGIVLAGFVLLVATVVVVNHWRGLQNAPTEAGLAKRIITGPTGIPTNTTSGDVVKRNSVVRTKPEITTTSPIVKAPPRKSNLAMASSRQPLVTRDFSLSSAATVRRESLAGGATPPVFPIDMSYPSLKVSLDDGSGNWRTISLPTVSFGSQRVLASGSVSRQMVPKGVW